MDESDLQCMSQILRHRLRGISAGIRGALGLIEEEAASLLPPGLLEYFPLMIRECDALQEVATRLSLYFDQPPPAEELAAEEVTRRVVEALRGRFPAVDIRVEGACGEIVHGWMELALAELGVNACEAAPHSEVRIRLQRKKDQVVWTVADFGSGLDPARPGDPFKPFHTTRPRHLGLGLPIARRLSERVGGGCVPSSDGPADAAWVVDLTCPVLERESPKE